MPIQVNSPGWKVRRAAGSRGAAAAAAADLPGLPSEFLTAESRVADEAVLEPAPATRGASHRPAAHSMSATISSRDKPRVLAIRHPSGALTFHLPVQSTSRGLRGPSQVRFQVDGAAAGHDPRPDRGGRQGDRRSRWPKLAVDKRGEPAAAQAGRGVRESRLEEARPPGRLVEAFEGDTGGRRARTGPAGFARALPAVPPRHVLERRVRLSSPGDVGLLRSRQRDSTAIAFSRSTISASAGRPERTPGMLLEGLPEQTTTFDVVTHSRGGLVLRNLVERARAFGDLSRRFKLGRAVLVASPNDGTPLATPKRWDDTVGWMANLLEMFPDNPFTTGAEFVANGLVWLRNHASGDLPGSARDGRRRRADYRRCKRPPGRRRTAYSALVANYSRPAKCCSACSTSAIDQFFGSANDLVVPSEGGWRIDQLGRRCSFRRRGSAASGPAATCRSIR